MHKFEKDFYGSNLRIAILGYLRGEMNFSSLDGLITQIKTDISNAEKLLEKDEYQTFKNESIFTQSWCYFRLSLVAIFYHIHLYYLVLSSKLNLSNYLLLLHKVTMQCMQDQMIIFMWWYMEDLIPDSNKYCKIWVSLTMILW